MSNDHKKRLQAKLEWEGFTETKVKSDGNCQFSSLADQLFNSSELHEKVRERVVKQIKYNPKSYKALMELDSSKKSGKNVPKHFSEYVKNMSRNGEWGDDVTLQAAADTFGMKIVLITSYKDDSPMEIFPKSLGFERVIYLSYLAGVHYNSIHLKEGSKTNIASTGNEKKKNNNQTENVKDKDETKIENENVNDSKDKNENANENENKNESMNKNENANENENKNESMNKNETEDDNDKNKDNQKKKKKNKNNDKTTRRNSHKEF